MAFAVFISLPMPLSAAKFPVKELPLRKAPLTIFSSQATVRTATNLLAHCCSNRERFSVSNCRGYLTSLHHFGELVSCCKSFCRMPLEGFHEIMCYWFLSRIAIKG